jgi:hypothetical protein
MLFEGASTTFVAEPRIGRRAARPDGSRRPLHDRSPGQEAFPRQGCVANCDPTAVVQLLLPNLSPRSSDKRSMRPKSNIELCIERSR